MSKLKFNVLLLGTLSWFAVLLGTLRRLGFGAATPLCPVLHYVIGLFWGRTPVSDYCTGMMPSFTTAYQRSCQSSRLYPCVTKTEINLGQNYLGFG